MITASSRVTRSLIQLAAPWFLTLAKWPKEERFSFGAGPEKQLHKYTSMFTCCPNSLYRTIIFISKTPFRKRTASWRTMACFQVASPAGGHSLGNIFIKNLVAFLRFWIQFWGFQKHFSIAPHLLHSLSILLLKRSRCHHRAAIQMHSYPNFLGSKQFDSSDLERFTEWAFFHLLDLIWQVFS